jgi:hypothetical protein
MLREEAFQGLQAFIADVDEQKYNAWHKADTAPVDAGDRAWVEGLVGPFENLKYPWDQWFPEFLGQRYPPAFVRKAREAHAKGDFTLLYRRGENGILAIPEGVKADQRIARPRTYITGLDPLSVDDISWGEVTSRLALVEFQRFLRSYIPGFEQCVMERIADSIGLRGGRHIDVPGSITDEQLDRGYQSPDAIFVRQRGKERAPVEIPYSALVPERIEGVLVVGKSTAGGVHMRTAHDVLFQGQAAGTAAALAVKQGVAPRRVNIRDVQAELKKTGVEIPY